MKKRVLAVLMAVFMFVTPVFAVTYTDIRWINGVEYIPVRAAAESLDWTVEWDDASKTVLLTAPDGAAVHEIPESVGQNIDGRIYIPRATADAIFELGAAIGSTAAQSRGIHGTITQVNYGDNTAYILGSMHLGQPDWFPLHDIVEDAMRQADVFAFEYDLNRVLTEAEELRIIEMQLLPDGMTLEDILPPDVFEAFLEALETYAMLGLTYDLIENFTPVTISSTLEIIMLNILGVDLELSVDGYVNDFAVANGRPVIGLNDMFSELELLFDISLEEQALMLVGFPDFMTLLEAYSDMGLIDAYASQNIALLTAMFGSPSYESEREYNLMYVRDHIFAEEIARLLMETEEPTVFFITMGLLHIFPDYGLVIDILEEMGFEIILLWQQI